MVDYGGTFIANILFQYLSDINILVLKFSCTNFVYVFEMKIYYQKIYLFNTTIYKECAQRVNVQYTFLTLYETKPGKKL